MRQTLFTIPSEIAGIPVFGFGWLLGLWTLASAGLLGSMIWRHGWTRETKSLIPALLVGAGALAFLMPALLDQGGLPIRGYGVMLLIAVASGVGLSVYRAHQVGFDTEIIFSLATWLFVAGIVGARVFYIIQKWHQFMLPTPMNPELGPTLRAMLDVTKGGLVVYGSLLAGGAALAVFVWKHRLNGLALSDLIGPGVILGMAIGRLGCFMNGCCYGGACELPWAVTFPAQSPPYERKVEPGLTILADVKFQEKNGNIIVDEVRPDSPAARSGLRPKDPVTNINGLRIQTVEDIDRALNALPQPSDAAYVAIEPRPLHPTQIYSFIDAGLLCLLLLAFDPYRRRAGEITALGLTLHSISRFLIEIIRTDEASVFGTGLSISQNISIVILFGAIMLWVYLLRQPADRRALIPVAA